MKDIPTDMQELLQRFDDWKLSTMIGEPDFDRYRGKPPVLTAFGCDPTDKAASPSRQHNCRGAPSTTPMR